MLFNSIEFLIFFPVVTIIYFLLPYKWRWLHLLIASCIFYMAFIPVYILILLFTIVVDYTAGIMIEGAIGHKRKLFLLLSIIANLGILGFFKYYHFFTDNVNELLNLLGIQGHQLEHLDIILPIGLSFHTFQALSYTIEVYRGNQKAERHFGIYSLYVMFFPQLMAGPIERPQNLLHQFYERFDMDYNRMRSGFMMMVWGFFMKVVIADRLALYINPVYGHLQDFHGLSIWVAVFFFAFQIYCDFAGYTFIALGGAKILGITLMQNFDSPFRSKNVTEFWRRWHISLSTWFNDYFFQPLVIQFRDWGKWGVVLGLLVTFALCGLWHGAGWTFVVFGLLHGIALVYEFLTKKTRLKISRTLPPLIYDNLSRVITFAFLVLTWIFFRSANLHQAGAVLCNAFDFQSPGAFNILFYKRDVYEISIFNVAISFMLIAIIILLDNTGFNIQELDKRLLTQPAYARWAVYYGLSLWLVYYVLILCIVKLGIFNGTHFMYFNF